MTRQSLFSSTDAGWCASWCCAALRLVFTRSNCCALSPSSCACAPSLLQSSPRRLSSAPLLCCSAARMSGTAAKASDTAAAMASSLTRWKPNVSHNLYWKSQRKQQLAKKLYARNLALAAGAKDEYGRPLFTKQTWHIVKGDMVEVTRTSAKRDRESGRGERLRTAEGGSVAEDWLGMRGRVLRVLRKTNQVIVEGVNMRTRVAQPTVQKTGHFYKLESPISYAHVTLVDPKTDKPANKIVKGGRVRITDSGAKVPKPWLQSIKLKYEARKKDAPPSELNPLTNPQVDTAPEVATEITYRRPIILRPSVRAETDPATGQPLIDELGRIVLIPEGMELKTARMKF